MDMRTLLIADSNEDFQSALAEALQGCYRVRCCGTGKEALAILREEHCDILVLDLMLPELDGISLLQTVVDEGIYPMVLAATRFVNDYVLEAADRLGVGYLVQKPCDAQATANRVADLNRRLHPPVQTQNPEVFVTTLLLSFGISTKHDGYFYLRDAILLMAQEPRQPVTKVIYPTVAEVYGCKGKQVEHSIRTALNAAWKHRNNELWQQYFHPSAKCPSNTEFITRLAECLRLGRVNGLVSGESAAAWQPSGRITQE